MGSKGQNSTLSEHGHVAYQIKENHEMQQNGSKKKLTTDPGSPPPPHDSRGWSQNSTF